jgi:hypothetical protein
MKNIALYIRFYEHFSSVIGTNSIRTPVVERQSGLIEEESASAIEKEISINSANFVHEIALS